MKWNGKKDSKGKISEEHDITPFHIFDIYPSSRIDPKSEENWQNLLIWGENKSVMNTLLKDFKKKISLIYIDPPFATGGDFNLKIQIGEKGNYLDNVAYEDKWGEGIDSYLAFLYERLILMKKLMSNNGSIYVHLDWHISHYIKLIMDEIFGIDNFKNEIIWAYPAASVKTRRFFIRSYDTILFYSKSDDYIFNDDPHIYMEYSNRVKTALKRDEHGLFYYRGGSHNGRKLSRKVYVENEGIFPRDVWNDIPYIRANTSEYQGFSTQKPERLLKRIILASTNEDDLIADFFCGSGTTLAVAEKLGRRWIGCDTNSHAIHMARKRILNIKNSKDMLNWKNLYQKEFQPFKILSCMEEENSFPLPSIFLSSDYKSKSGFQIKETPDFDVKLHKNNNKIVVELLNYIIPFTSVISKEIKEKIASFSDWIDYWAVDFDTRGDLFINIWYSYRTPKTRMLSTKSDVYHYEEPGNYKISIKIIDIFGIQTQKSFNIKISFD
ncbi:MAG: site-specific DNA-methyltransferase [Promethearchaeota archaeon]